MLQWLLLNAAMVAVVVVVDVVVVRLPLISCFRNQHVLIIYLADTCSTTGDLDGLGVNDLLVSNPEDEEVLPPLSSELCVFRQRGSPSLTRTRSSHQPAQVYIYMMNADGTRKSGPVIVTEGSNAPGNLDLVNTGDGGYGFMVRVTCFSF